MNGGAVLARLLRLPSARRAEADEDLEVLRHGWGDLYVIGCGYGTWWAYRRHGGGGPVQARTAGKLAAALRADHVAGDAP